MDYLEENLRAQIFAQNLQIGLSWLFGYQYVGSKELAEVIESMRPFTALVLPTEIRSYPMSETTRQELKALIDMAQRELPYPAYDHLSSVIKMYIL